MHPVYKDSKLVNQAASASRLIVMTSAQISNMMQSGADNFTSRTKPVAQPLTFTPTTHDRVRKINALTQGAAGLSAKTVGQVSKYAQNIGAAMVRHGHGRDKDGKVREGYKPGILNKSMIAFSTVADGIDQGARNLLTSGSTAATTVVGHRYGDDAREVTRQLAGGVKNVGLVYVDASGVSRKAVVKSVAKGMVLGRVKGGGEVVVGGSEVAYMSAAAAPPPNPAIAQSSSAPQPQLLQQQQQQPQYFGGQPGTTQVGFGNALPPIYSPGVGEPLAGTARQGQDADLKR